MRPHHASVAKQEEQEVNKVKPTEMATLFLSLSQSLPTPWSESLHPSFSLKRFFCPSTCTLLLPLLCSLELSLSELGIPTALGEMEGERVLENETAAALVRQ